MIVYRPIEQKDNENIAQIIRQSLTEFGADKPGTNYYDPNTDSMFEYFRDTLKAHYFVVEINGLVAGGAGIYPSKGLDSDTCELVRMYLAKDHRGQQIGQTLLDLCFEKAKENQFSRMYIETMPELTTAIPFYEKNGFQHLKKPLGNTGHTGCGIWMSKYLNT